MRRRALFRCEAPRSTGAATLDTKTGSDENVAVKLADDGPFWASIARLELPVECALLPLKSGGLMEAADRCVLAAYVGSTAF